MRATPQAVAIERIFRQLSVFDHGCHRRASNQEWAFANDGGKAGQNAPFCQSLVTSPSGVETAVRRKPARGHHKIDSNRAATVRDTDQRRLRSIAWADNAEGIAAAEGHQSNCSPIDAHRLPTRTATRSWINPMIAKMETGGSSGRKTRWWGRAATSGRVVGIRSPHVAACSL